MLMWDLPKIYEMKGNEFIGERAAWLEEGYQETNARASLSRIAWYEMNVVDAHMHMKKNSPANRMYAVSLRSQYNGV